MLIRSRRTGFKADPAKTMTVLWMPTPTDVASLRRLTGFINYLSKFLWRLSDLCELLRTNLRDNAVQQASETAA